MSPETFQRELHRIDPELTLTLGGRRGGWVVTKRMPKVVFQHSAPDKLPDTGVFVVREVALVPEVMFALPYGLTEASLTTAKRAAFWKRGVSAKEVADAMDRDDALLSATRAKERRAYNQAFTEDYGKQIARRLNT